MVQYQGTAERLLFLQVEYALNDGYIGGDIDNPLRRSFERLIRQLLVFPKRPAVVLLMFSSAEF